VCERATFTTGSYEWVTKSTYGWRENSAATFTTQTVPCIGPSQLRSGGMVVQPAKESGNEVRDSRVGRCRLKSAPRGRHFVRYVARAGNTFASTAVKHVSATDCRGRWNIGEAQQGSKLRARHPRRREKACYFTWIELKHRTRSVGDQVSRFVKLMW